MDDQSKALDQLQKNVSNRSDKRPLRSFCHQTKNIGFAGSLNNATGCRGVITGMAKEWIANLAQDIKQKNREAAENYGRAQHRAGIIDNLGMPFFAAFVSCLEEDIQEIRSQLQGDVTSSDTIIQIISPDEVKLTRSRFPWFDARITHHDANIILDYAKGLGIAGDPMLDRKTSHFAFYVAEDDTFSIQESFGDPPRKFHHPEELAKHVMELLFQV